MKLIFSRMMLKNSFLVHETSKLMKKISNLDIRKLNHKGKVIVSNDVWKKYKDMLIGS